MKKKLLLLLPLLIAGFSLLPAEAGNYVQLQDNEYSDNPNVDVFKPTSGVKVKTSPLAQMMENATKNATQKNNNTNSVQKTTQQKPANQSSWF